MIRSEIKKKAQFILHGKYGNWSLIVLVPFVIGGLLFLFSLFFVSNTVGEYDSNQYQSWQDNHHGRSSRGTSKYSGNQYDDVYEEGYVAGYSEGYDEGWSDGWDDSLIDAGDVEDKLDNYKDKKLETLSSQLQPLNTMKEINYTNVRRYQNTVNYGNEGVGGGFFFLLLSLLMGFMLVLYEGMLKWAAIDSIKGTPFTLKTVFEDFIRKNGKKVAVANFWVTLYTFLWSLLFVIPGVVKGSSYSMTNYLMKKDEQLSAKEAIVLSQKLMNGYKIEYLILRVSFIFWSYANIFSFGLASFYVLPYLSVTEALFFDQVIQDKHHLFTGEQEAGFEDF